MRSSKARKQRKAFFNAPLHQRRKHISAHLEENLLLKYDRRQTPVVKGDTVRIMRGSFKGHESKVTSIYLKKHMIEIEGITNPKADGKKVARPVHPSNVLITKLNLTDKWRRRRLEEGLSEDTKKEIESEAKKQIREQKIEEEQQRIEEERLAAEAEAEESLEESIDEPIEEIKDSEIKQDKKPSKTVEAPPEEKTPSKKTEAPSSDKKETKKEEKSAEKPTTPKTEKPKKQQSSPKKDKATSEPKKPKEEQS